jgi:L,D-transpeptidase YbiS
MGVITLEVDIELQKMFVMENGARVKEYVVSTGKNGAGEGPGSEQTPRGLHVIRAKFGGSRPINSVFVGRRATGEIFEPGLREKYPERDWILTRIMWLSGLEMKRNRETMARYIYIHGAPDDVVMGLPGSRGCVRMRNQDIIELFESVDVGTKILIKDSSVCQE